MTAPRALCFDAGQTLLELDTALLARRLGERGLDVRAAALDAAMAAAWRAYDDDVARGGRTTWHTLMDALLAGAGVAREHASERAALVAWLWREQPARNLWRRPVPGMIELARSARAAGLGVAIISNSEGRLRELITDVGWADVFEPIADSGQLGMEKPARGIFDWTFARLGVGPDEVVHIGDSWPADVEGARAVGAKAIWFGRIDGRALPAGVAVARDATEVRAALTSFGLRW